MPAEHYGFILDHNPHDQALLPISAFPDSFATYLQQQQHNSSQCWLHCNGIPGWQLLRDLRCWAVSPAERKIQGHLAGAGQRISITGDTKVCCFLSSTPFWSKPVDCLHLFCVSSNVE